MAISDFFHTSVTTLYLHPLTSEWIPDAVELDRKFLGGLWSAEGYQREVDGSNSLLLALSRPDPQVFKKNGDLLSADPADSQVFSKTENLALLGFGALWMILDEAHITLLVVDEVYRGQGLGRALLIALLEAARDHDMARATLEVRPSNERAIALYHAFGFQEAGRRKKYYHDPIEDALILWRSGLQSQEFADNLCLWKEELSDRLDQSGWKIEEARV